MNDTRAVRADLTSFSQLVQEVIAGAIRRNTFSEWELDLLLDLQTCPIRRSARPDVLRGYLKAVHQSFAAGAAKPPRFASFVERRRQPRGISARLATARVAALG